MPLDLSDLHNNVVIPDYLVATFTVLTEAGSTAKYLDEGLSIINDVVSSTTQMLRTRDYQHLTSTLTYWFVLWASKASMNRSSGKVGPL